MMETGLKETSRIVVDEARTARQMGSGDLDVLATPALVALMENAAMRAVAAHLPDGATTVGALMHTSHLKPTAVGQTVEATAVLTSVEGRKLTFEVRATDNEGLVGEGTHVRYVVDRDRFVSKLTGRG